MLWKFIHSIGKQQDEDLHQVLRIALWKAAESFEPSKCASGKFSARAWYAMQWAYWAEMKKRRKFEPEVVYDYGSSVDRREREYLPMKLQKRDSESRGARSLETKVIAHTIRQWKVKDFTRAVESEEISEQLLAKLKPSEAQLLREYYLQGMTFAEVGALHGFTRQRAEQKVQAAVRRLKYLEFGE